MKNSVKKCSPCKALLAGWTVRHKKIQEHWNGVKSLILFFFYFFFHSLPLLSFIQYLRNVKPRGGGLGVWGEVTLPICQIIWHQHKMEGRGADCFLTGLTLGWEDFSQLGNLVISQLQALNRKCTQLSERSSSGLMWDYGDNCML